jgi:hypothetical protein
MKLNIYHRKFKFKWRRNIGIDQIIKSEIVYPKLKYIYVSHNGLTAVPEISDKNQVETTCLDNN